MVKHLSFLILGLFVSCGVKVNILDDKLTAVPIDDRIFKNKNFFDRLLLNSIDTTAIYIEDCNFESSEKDFKNVNNKVYRTRDYHNICYVFYSNGCVNLISAYRKDYFDVLEVEDLDPLKTGYRGVFYKKNNQIQIDLFTITGYNFKREYGINTSIIKIKGDTLFRKSKFDMKTVTVYLKKKLPKDFLIYKPDW
ncbi:hypothetical protein B4N84_21465 [Flavobacterium sp. IR1]|nr:hypothetical protein B4N84_21465 [Flavobacterium sp. IR1]